jgi:hypothetical protein
MLAYHFREGIDVMFSMADTRNAQNLKNGNLKINGIQIPGPGAFQMNENDGRAYANDAKGNRYIIVDPPHH